MIEKIVILCADAVSPNEVLLHRLATQEDVPTLVIVTEEPVPDIETILIGLRHHMELCSLPEVILNPIEEFSITERVSEYNRPKLIGAIPLRKQWSIAAYPCAIIEPP